MRGAQTKSRPFIQAAFLFSAANGPGAVAVAAVWVSANSDFTKNTCDHLLLLNGNYWPVAADLGAPFQPKPDIRDSQKTTRVFPSQQVADGPKH